MILSILRCGEEMKKILIGYVSGVHGLRGDLKIKSNFKSADKVFLSGNTIYLNDEIHTITSCKLYKGYYLVTIDNIRDINAVEHFKGFDVFIDRDSLKLGKGEYLIDDLEGMTVLFNGINYGRVIGISDNGVYCLLEIDYKKSYMIPLVDEFIKKVDLDSNTIEVDNIEGLII